MRGYSLGPWTCSEMVPLLKHLVVPEEECQANNTTSPDALRHKNVFVPVRLYCESSICKTAHTLFLALQAGFDYHDLSHPVQ